MEDKTKYEEIIEQIRKLPADYQRRLIDDLKASLLNTIKPPSTEMAALSMKSSADFYGVMQGIVYDESDFEAAQWRPDF